MSTGFIGAGTMASAIIESLLRADMGGKIKACDISKDRQKLLKRKYGIAVTSDALEVVAESDVVFLGVKPADLDMLLTHIAPHVRKKQIVVSIAAGKRLRMLESILPEVKVVRAMPNLPCLVGEGITALCGGRLVKAPDMKKVTQLLSCMGKTVLLPEDKFDVVTAVSGSGPAFFIYFLASLIEGGVKAGLARDKCVLLAEQTMLGAARLAASGKMSHHDIIKAVTSAKGVTQAGLDVLEKYGVQSTVIRTIESAVRRSQELSGS